MLKFSYKETHGGKPQEQFGRGISRDRNFAAFDYCLHNQLQFYN